MLTASNWQTGEKIKLENVKEVKRTMFDTTVIFKDGTERIFRNFAWDIF